jgi:flagellar hook-basal body complex protein FliE
MLDTIAPTAPVLSISGGEAASSASTAGASGAFARVGGSSVASGAEQDFSAVFDKLLSDSIGTLKAAEVTSIKGVKGQASVQEVVEAVMAAEQTLQGGIAIRDKVVSAYLEISRMAI